MFEEAMSDPSSAGGLRRASPKIFRIFGSELEGFHWIKIGSRDPVALTTPPDTIHQLQKNVFCI